MVIVYAKHILTVGDSLQGDHEEKGSNSLFTMSRLDSYPSKNFLIICTVAARPARPQEVMSGIS